MRDHVGGTCRSDMQQRQKFVLHTEGHVTGTCSGDM